MDKKERLKQLLRATNALLEAMRYSTTTPDGEYANIGRWTSFRMFLRKYNDLVKEAAPLLSSSTMVDTIKFDKLPTSGGLTWPAQKELFDLGYSNTALLKSLLEGEIGYAEDEAQNLRDFITGNLRRAIFGVPEKELDVQNSFEAMIIGRGMSKGTDYDRETGRAKASGKESVPDFIFPPPNLCLELKLSKTADKLRAIVDEINADIRAYATRYERQFYIGYDLGTIRDEAEFKRDLESAPGVSVLVVKH